MSEKAKHKVANLCVIMVIIFSMIYLFGPMLGGFNWLLWMLAILNLIAGPAALIGYIREVRRGIFSDVEEIANAEDE